MGTVCERYEMTFFSQCFDNFSISYFYWFFHIQIDDAECELNCRPINQKYFARLREYAVDGTHCSKVHLPPKSSNGNETSYEKSVCVEGKCKVSSCENFKQKKKDEKIKKVFLKSICMLQSNSPSFLQTTFLRYYLQLKLFTISFSLIKDSAKWRLEMGEKKNPNLIK